MNKKLLSALIVTIFAVPAAAQGALQLPPRWQEAVHQKVDYTSFEYAMNTLKKPLLLTIPVTKQFFDMDDYGANIPFEQTTRYRQLSNVQTYPSTAGCKAYALDDHWVVAGGTCLWNGRHTIEFTDRSGKFATGLVEVDASRKNLQLDDAKIPWELNLFIQPHENQAPHVILVHVPERTPLGHRLEKMPKINILAFERTTPASLIHGDFYINTARFGLNTNRKRTIQKVVHGIVTLQDHAGDLSGVSTDPLVYVREGRLHWIGVNKGITNLRYNNLAGDWAGETSNDYFYFTKEDADFIKGIISVRDLAAWQRIEARKGLKVW